MDIGDAALYDNSTRNYNVAVGNSALNNNTTGFNNTASGGKQNRANWSFVLINHLTFPQQPN